MSALPAIPETAMPGVRFIRVEGDHMLPTLTPQDYVAVMPTGRWHGDGLYLIHDGFAGVVWRVQLMIGQPGHFEVYGDRPGSARVSMSRERFLDLVLGVVAATVHVSRPQLLERAGRAGA